jgi:TonB family protein
VKRLAFFSPVPPAATGVADYVVDVLSLLVPRYDVDVFHDQAAPERDRLPAGAGVHHHSEFAGRQAARRYDLAVYQMGNGPAHDFVYAPLVRVPGLLVLHDLVLHHGRGRMFLDGPEARAYARAPGSAEARAAAATIIGRYAAEVAYSYPAQAGRLVEAHLGTVGDLLPYAYPLLRLPVEASRAVAVHNDFMAQAIAAEVPGADVVRIPMPMQSLPVAGAAVDALRRRYGITADDFVVGTFGLVTREKRVDTIARAVVRAARLLPRVRLLVVGPVTDRGALEARLAGLGVASRAIVTGRVPFSELAAHIELADAVAHLRHPTARETSAALLRVLAQGRATIMGDLEHLADVPRDAVVRADMADEEGEVTRAILNLAASPARRARLGRAARAFVERAHAPARTAEAYASAIERAPGRRTGPPSVRRIRVTPASRPRNPRRPAVSNAVDGGHAMDRRLFEDLVVSAPPAGRGRRAALLPLSIAAHAAALAVALLVPVLRSGELPTPAGPTVIWDRAPVAPTPPPPTATPPPTRVTKIPPTQVSAPTTEADPAAPPPAPGPTVSIFEPSDLPPNDTPAPCLVNCDATGPRRSSDGPSDGSDAGATGGTGPVRPGGDIKPPIRTAYVAPIYPDIARAAGVSGMVVLECTIDPTGHVVDARVITGHPLLNAAALDAVRQWRYSATRLNGVPVAVLMTVTVRFIAHR